MARSTADSRPEAVALLAAIHAALPDLDALFAEMSGHWQYEDLANDR